MEEAADSPERLRRAESSPKKCRKPSQRSNPSFFPHKFQKKIPKTAKMGNIAPFFGPNPEKKAENAEKREKSKKTRKKTRKTAKKSEKPEKTAKKSEKTLKN